MHIRNYKDADFPQLKKLLVEGGLYYKPLDKRSILKKKVEHDLTSIIVGEDGGRIVGTVFMVYDPWNSFIYHLGVHPDYKGRGLGDRLMDEAEKRLKKKGKKRITLFVEEKNQELVEFYKKRGWFILDKVIDMEKEL